MKLTRGLITQKTELHNCYRQFFFTSMYFFNTECHGEC